MYILPDKGKACLSSTTKIEVVHFGFMCFAFVNMLCILPIGFGSHEDKSW